MSPKISTQTVLTVAATVVIASLAWSKTPRWLKESLTGSKGEAKDANDDLADPVAVFSKVKEVIGLAHGMCGDFIPDDMPYFKLQCCFLSMIHLMNEIDHNHPDWRENYFSKDGTDVNELELETLAKYLEFAKQAYQSSALETIEWLHPKQYQLLRHDNATEPGRVGHFIAVHHAQKEVVIAIKGTSSFSDVLADIVGKAIPHDSCPGLRCHEGIMVAANMMMDETSHLIQHFFMPQKYKVVIVGHSLGAGVSSLMGIFLKQAFPNLDLKVYAYATPACCSYQASLDAQDYITAIVNNHDCVPRMTIPNLRLMSKLFVLIDSKLEEKGLSPKNFTATKNYVKDLLITDQHLLVEPNELNKFLDTEFAADEKDKQQLEEVQLYVPGKVVAIWNHTKDPAIIGGKVTNGNSQVLKQIFVESNMISDHSCDSYRQNIMALLEQTANTI